MNYFDAISMITLHVNSNAGDQMYDKPWKNWTYTWIVMLAIKCMINLERIELKTFFYKMKTGNNKPSKKAWLRF